MLIAEYTGFAPAARKRGRNAMDLLFSSAKVAFQHGWFEAIDLAGSEKRSERFPAPIMLDTPPKRK